MPVGVVEQHVAGQPITGNVLRDLGDSVLALGELIGTGRITGLNLSAEIAQLVTFRDGRIVSFRDFASHAEALQAVGLPE